MSPTVVHVGRIEIGIRTKERNHRRPHCHATYPNQKSPEAAASIALDNFEVLASYGFDAPTLNAIVSKVRNNQEALIKKWEEIYGKAKKESL